MLLQITKFGGINANDEPEYLINRTHQQSEYGFSQVYPTETPICVNIDKTREGIRKRKGSTADTGVDTAMVANDVLVAMTRFINLSNVEVEIAVGKKSIYIRSTGAWAQINDSTSSAYTHNADVTKCTFAEVDGHLFIGLDGNNYIQTYKDGADLDAEMDAGNNYEDAYGGGTHVITGTWTTGAYLVTNIHQRLAYSSGSPLLEYTPVATAAGSGIWDVYNSGFYAADSNIKALFTFVADLSDTINQILYVATSQGMQAVTGFLDGDTIYRIKGSKVIHGYQSYAIGKNWVYYLTEDRGIAAINGRTTIDIGRRLNSNDKDGVIDDLDGTNGYDNLSFGFYNEDKRQVIFHYTRETGGVVNGSSVVVDISLGEPQVGEPQESYEKRISLLYWESSGKGDEWFHGAYVLKDQKVRGFLTDGTLWRIEQGNNDFGDTAIESYWATPIFNANFADRLKQWGLIKGRFDAQFIGSAVLNVEAYYDRDATIGKEFELKLTNPIVELTGGGSSTTDYQYVLQGGKANVHVDITAVTLSGSSPVKITAANHGLGESGFTSIILEKTTFSSVGGTIELNGLVASINKVDANNFTLIGTNSRNYTAWTSGGTVDTQTTTVSGGSAVYVPTASGIGIGQSGIAKDQEYIAKRSETLQLKFINNEADETFTIKNITVDYTVGATIGA